MPSNVPIEALAHPPAGMGTLFREFVRALAHRRTYSPLTNPFTLFGFLWGLPIPVFSIWLDLWASGRSFAPGFLLDRPVHLLFLLHPFIFGVLFGAMGTVRHRKDLQIAHLIETLGHHVSELASANDKLHELDHLKAQFIANVTHELKTPLVAIRGYNESILERRFGPITDKQHEGLAIAVRNVERLEKLIGELLEFERIESGDLRLEIDAFDLRPVLQAALQNFRPETDRKRLTAVLEAPAEVRVRADRERIARVVQNLVSNAVKFTPEGGTLGITVRPQGDRAHITVWDHGSGIPAAARKFLFTRFWQADGSLRRRAGGTGLGLAICKGILDAHRSAIDIESSEGEGTRVHFGLPLAGPDSPVEEGRHERQTADPRR